MKNTLKLITLLTPLLFGASIFAQQEQKTEQQKQAPSKDMAWVYIVNKTGYPLRVWWGGHRTRSDSANFKKLAKGGKIFFWLRDAEAMNGPLFIQKAGKSFEVATEKLGGIDYEVINSVPEAYFYPANKHTNFFKSKELTIEVAGRYDFRVKQTLPISGKFLSGAENPWVKTTATTVNPLTGEYKPLTDVLNKLQEGAPR